MNSGRSPTRREQLRHALGAFFAILHAVHQQRFADNVEQRHARIQRAVRVLKDHLHLRAQRAQLGARHLRQINDLTLSGAKEHLAARRLISAQHAARRRRLATAAFAD